MELAGVRKDVAFACEQLGVSERRACKLIALDRSSYRYEPRSDHNAALRQELVTLARQKPRYGYRRLHALVIKRGLPDAERVCRGAEILSYDWLRKTRQVNCYVAWFSFLPLDP